MGLSTALQNALSGMVANAEAITVFGDNISNVNTTAFKASRPNFETQISLKLGDASGPIAARGGTNPTQVGLGVNFGAVSRDPTGGAVTLTGVNTEMAVEGSGFFVLNDGANQVYTRAGNFRLDGDFNLVDSSGARVQGFGVDTDFNVVEGTLVDVVVPIGTVSIAQATENVRFTGNLNSSGDLATQGAQLTSAPIFSDAGATTPAVAGDALTSLFDGTGTPLFATNDVITFNNIIKGATTLQDRTFEVNATNTTASDGFGTTLADLLAFVEDVIGIDTAISGGATISAAGEIVVSGNTGTDNDITFDATNIITNAGSAGAALPFTFTKDQAADGESARTNFFGFDSLGNELTFDVSIVLEGKSNSGTDWRFYVQSDDDSLVDRVVSSGTLSFNNDGQILGTTGTNIAVDLNGTGAFSPQPIQLQFDSAESPLTALADDISTINPSNQDGFPLGTLVDFSVGSDGTIVGIFSNGQSRNQGRVALANFANPGGLESIGGNRFTTSANVGTPVIVSPGSGGTGRIIGGALELSNVDITEEFINLINASTGFRASSRVLSTSDQLIQELLASV